MDLGAVMWSQSKRFLLWNRHGAITQKQRQDLTMDNDLTISSVDYSGLGQFFLEAEKFGAVGIYTMTEGYHDSIKFPSIAGTSLEAKSNFNHKTPQNLP